MAVRSLATLCPKRLLLAFAVLALAARAFVPVGWMPSQSGAFTFEICTDGGVAKAWIDADGKLRKDKPDDGAGKHQPCAFASAAAADFGQPAGLAAGLLFAALPPFLAASAVSIGHGLAAPPPPSTGPPLLT